MSSFMVPGKPAGKARPRLNRGTGHIYSPDPGNFQVRVAEYGHVAGIRPQEGPIKLTVAIHRHMPNSWSKKKKDAMIGKPAEGIPDVNNVVGAVLDGLEGVAYYNDSQVARIEARRHWTAAEDATLIWAERAHI